MHGPNKQPPVSKEPSGCLTLWILFADDHSENNRVLLNVAAVARRLFLMPTSRAVASTRLIRRIDLFTQLCATSGK